MFKNILLAAGLLGLASAQSYTPPGKQIFGALYTPDTTHPVTLGETFQVTWSAAGHETDGSTVSLVLCRGGSGNCVNAPTAIATGIPAKNAQYAWSVPCSLAPGVQSTATGYGMLIIVDGTGDFQYSTQFSVLAGTKCGSTSPNSTTSTTSMMSSTQMTSTSTYGSWAILNSTTTTTTPYTTKKPMTTTTTPMMLTTTSTALVLTTPSASATPSQFKGAAAKVGGSAAALVLAAGAAVLAI